jgi:hypothetical protein
MGVAKIGRTRARPGSLEDGADAYRCLEIPEQASSRTATMGHKVVGVVCLILVAIIELGYVVGSMRTSLFGP